MIMTFIALLYHNATTSS